MATTNKKIRFTQPYNGPKKAMIKVDGKDKEQVVTGEYVKGEETQTGEREAIGDALAIHLIELGIAEEVKEEQAANTANSNPQLNQGSEQGKDKDKTKV